MRYSSLLRTVLGVGAVAVATLVSVRPAAADLLSGFKESRVMRQHLAGRLTKTQYPATSLGESRTVFVYTPPGFDPGAARRYPVLVLLHGTPGDPLDWLYRGGVHSAIDHAIVSGYLPPCIVAIPDGHGPFYRGGSEWANDIKGRCAMETAITHDLAQFLEGKYHAAADPGLWAIGGLSEGGYGAANLTVRHPERFRNALILSGDLQVSDDWGDASDVFGDGAAERSANSPIEQIKRVEPDIRKNLRFYVAVGADDDDALVSQCVGFTCVARSVGATVQLARDPGRHNWDFWSAHLKDGLGLLSQWWKQAEQHPTTHG